MHTLTVAKMLPFLFETIPFHFMFINKGFLVIRSLSIFLRHPVCYLQGRTDVMTHCFSSQALSWNDPENIWKRGSLTFEWLSLQADSNDFIFKHGGTVSHWFELLKIKKCPCHGLIGKEPKISLACKIPQTSSYMISLVGIFKRSRLYHYHPLI